MAAIGVAVMALILAIAALLTHELIQVGYRHELVQVGYWCSPTGWLHCGPATAGCH